MTTCCAALLLAAPARAQLYPNLTLEPERNHRQPLLLWNNSAGPNGQVALDSTVRHQGRASLRLDLPAAPGGRAARTYVGCPLALDSTRGQLLTVSAWVRKQNWRGHLTWQASATSTTLAGMNAETASITDSLPGSSDWRQLTVRLPVPAGAYGLVITLWAEGSGQVWLDEVTLRVRGRRLPELPARLTEALLLEPEASLAANWDLEKLPPAVTRPDAATATLRLDSLGPQHGRYALHLERRSPAGQPAPVVYLGTLPVAPRDAGKTLRVSGFWRRPGAAVAGTGATPLLAVRRVGTSRLDNRWRVDTLGLKPAGPAPGPVWTRFSADVPVQLHLALDDEPVSLSGLSIGVLLPDAQPLEVDNLTFQLDGQPYAPTGPPLPPPPSALETGWLRATLKPLRLTAPATAGPDVAALGARLASARLLGLGELSHGSREVFALHGELVRYLVGQQHYAGLLLDADPLACEALQRYLRTGQGDPAQLLAALGDHWQVPEAVALLRWLRQYQQTHPATPLLLAGLAPDQPEQALAGLRGLLDSTDTFGQAHLTRAAQLLAAFSHPAPTAPDLRHHPAQDNDSLLAPLRQTLRELTDALATRAQAGGHPVSLAQLTRQGYLLRLVEQGATWRRIPAPDTAWNYCQACLAENAWYQTEHTGGAKLLLWASNRSVGYALAAPERPMGEWLRATLGTGYRALGVVLGQGAVATPTTTTTGLDGPWQPAPLAAPRPDAYEAWLRTGPPGYWLPLAGLELSDENAWLFQHQLLRDIERRVGRNQYRLHSLHDEFDAVVYLRDATPALP